MLLIEMVKEEIVKYSRFCFDCGRNECEIVDELFKSGKFVFKKGRVSSIGDGLHKINISRSKATGSFDAFLYHDLSQRKAEFFCINCGKMVSEFEKRMSLEVMSAMDADMTLIFKK